jgi:hypothetical protein
MFFLNIIRFFTYWKYQAAQADRMSVGAIYMANRGMVFNNLVGSVNLFPWVKH